MIPRDVWQRPCSLSPPARPWYITLRISKLMVRKITLQQNPMEVFQKESPEVAAAFNGLIMSLVASKGLDAKTRQLIYIAMKASMGDQMAVKAHIPMAKAAGATKEEVVDAILMTLTVSGIRGVVSCLPEAVSQFEK
ncbi:MAG: carboxymuconolactone decarboxylase family protein [Methanoregula sp.]|nr:carboxymuconolactone decarboxylase family protein [Methanoregula sp.]